MAHQLELGSFSASSHLLPGIEILSAEHRTEEPQVAARSLLLADGPASPATSQELVTRYLSISGMTCAACSSTVEKVLQKVEGVEAVSVSLMQNLAEVVFDANTVMVSTLALSLTVLQGFDRRRMQFE
jgi:copper chaperone CopZ